MFGTSTLPNKLDSQLDWIRLIEEAFFYVCLQLGEQEGLFRPVGAAVVTQESVKHTPNFDIQIEHYFFFFDH